MFALLVPTAWGQVAPEEPGDLTITEIMIDPAVVGHELGQWVEVRNNTSDLLDLDGVTLEDDGGQAIVLGSVTLDAGELLVLGTNADPKINGNVPVDVAYAYGDLGLVSGTDGLALYIGATLLDAVSWEPGWGISEDAAHQVNANALGLEWPNDLAHNWCPSPDAIPDSGGLFGTPGTENPWCGDPTVDADGDGFSLEDGDCDDTSGAVHPEAVDGAGDPYGATDDDADCDGVRDDGLTDDDGDGFAEIEGDCNDENPAENPDGVETSNGLDDDCSGCVDDIDADGDGWTDCQLDGGPYDCDDDDAGINPDAKEVDGDNVDNDCDGVIDSGDLDPGVDHDGDGYTIRDGDCLDDPAEEGAELVYPGARERCDDLWDNDCNGLFNDGCTNEVGYATLSGGGCAVSPMAPSLLVVLLVVVMLRHRRILPLLVLGVLPPMARAQSVEQDFTIDLELFRPPSDGMGYFGVPSASTLGHLQVGLSVWGNYQNDPLVLVHDGERVAPATQPVNGDDGGGVIDDRFTSNFQLGMGLSRFFSFTVDVPVVMWQDGYDLDTILNPEEPPRSLISSGVGDVRLVPKLVALDLDQLPVGLAVVVPVGLATGNGGDFLGEEDVSVTPMGVLEVADGSIRRRGYTFRLAAHGGYRIRTEGRIRDVPVGNAAVFGAGLGIRPVDVLELVAEFQGTVFGEISAQQAAETNLGFKFLAQDYLSINMGGGFGVLPGLGAPDYRIFGGITVAPSFDPALRDSDKDGIPNSRDQCVRDPEDPDGFEDEDGCPDLDNDKDGIPDEQDPCPMQAEDIDGFEDEDGCPDVDNDKDNILDVADQCPDEAEVLNGHLDEDGCPDDLAVGDTDGDGYADDVDHCPYDAEDFDGDRDEDGCPDEQELVIIEKDFIRINDKIFFEFNKAAIQARSDVLLDAIAQVIADNPGLTRIRIEGHTDSVGGDIYNLELSQARAESVKSALVQRGIAPERLDPVGFGEMRPIQTNDNDEGRAANRRVEFIIVERE